MKLRTLSTTVFLLLISCSVILPTVGLQGSKSIPSNGAITYGVGTPDLLTCERIDPDIRVLSEPELR